jgi:K+-transporting ATPase KdpF subunit
VIVLAFLDLREFSGLVLGVLLIGYLLFALLFPEKL